MEKDGRVWRQWIAWMLVAGLILGLDKLGWLRLVKEAAEIPLRPVREAALGVERNLSSPWRWLLTVRHSQARVEDLERQVAELTVEAARTKELARENQALKKLAAVVSEREVKWQAAPVKLVGIGEDWLVASGTREGIKEGMVVVSEEGVLVGRVIEASEFISRVRPVIHPASEVEVVTELGVKGVVVGEAGGLVLKQVLQAEELKAGDVVVTSGGEGIFLPNLVLGTVEQVNQVAADVYKSATLKPLFNLELMRYVFVLE